MSLADFLAQVAPSLDTITNPMRPGARPMGPTMGGFGGGTFGMDGRPVAQPQQPMQQQAQPQQAPQRKQDSGLRRLLGNLGDALLIGSGGEAMYKPAQEKRQQGEMLGRYLGAIDPQLAEIAQADPEAGMALFNILREDRRFDRTAGQDDQRIGIAGGQLDLGRAELGERKRANMAGEGLTERGQTLSSTTQVKLQQMRAQEAAAGRAHQAALTAGDRQHAERMLGLQQQFQREIALLTGENGATETVTIEEPGTEAVDGGWFGTDTPATPSRTTVTKRPIAPQQQQGGPSQADLEFTAKKHGITVEEVRRRLGAN